MLRVIAVSLFLSLAVPGLAAAAESHPSLVEAPILVNPLAKSMVDDQGRVRDAAMLRAPVDPRYADLDGTKMKAMVEEVAAISRKDRASGNLFWGRNLGTQGHIDAEDWAAAKFRALGLKDVRKQPVEIGAIWSPKAYEIVFSAGGEPLKLTSARPSRAATPTLDLPLVWGGLGSEADLLGRDLTGKAVLIQNVLLPVDRQSTAYLDKAAERAYRDGAAAVVMIAGLAENLSVWDDTGGGPGVNVGYEDGKRLRDLLGQGKPVRLRYSLDAVRQPALPTADVLAVLPGAGDEEVMLVAHLDGYFEGAIDNASGLAVMMALAEHYAKIPQAQRGRTLVFVAAAGHHDGGQGTLPVHQAHDFSKTAWIANLEHVAHVSAVRYGHRLRRSTATEPMRWTVRASARATQIVLDAFRKFNVGLFAEMEPRAFGEIGAIYADAPSIEAISGPEVKHSEQDTVDWVPANGLEQIARAHAQIIDDLAPLSLEEIRPATGAR